MTQKSFRVSPWSQALVWVVLCHGVGLAALVFWFWDALVLPRGEARGWVLWGLGAAALVSLAVVALSFFSLMRTRRLQPGTRGRLRWTWFSVTGALHFSVHTTFAALWWWHHWRAPRAAPDSMGLDVTLGSAVNPFLPEWLHPLLWLEGMSLATLVITAIALWPRLSARYRRALLWLLDGALLAATVAAWWWWPASPSEAVPATVYTASARLAVTSLFSARAMLRALPLFMNWVERTGFQWFVAMRQLSGKKSSFVTFIGLLSVLAVVVSTSALTVTLSVMGGFRNDLKEKILGNRAHLSVRSRDGRFHQWQRVLKELEASPQVIAASPYAEQEVMVTSASNLAGVVLRGVQTKRFDRASDLPEKVTEGKFRYLDDPGELDDLDPFDTSATDAFDADFRRQVDTIFGDPPPRRDPLVSPTNPDALADPGDALSEDVTFPSLIVGRELARALRVYVGDEVTVVSPLGELGPAGPIPKSRTFRVAAVFYTGMYEYDMKQVYAALPVAQTFLGFGEAVTGIEAKVKDMNRAPEVAQGFRGALRRGDLEVLDWRELNRSLFGALALEKVAMFVILGLGVLVAGFCVFATLMLMVEEKSAETGLLASLGATRRQLVRVFLLEGGFIGVLGAAVGLGVGYVLCFAAKHFGVSMNPEVYYIDQLPVHLDPVEFAWVGLVSVGICLGATVFPAWLASRIRPAEALRHG